MATPDELPAKLEQYLSQTNPWWTGIITHAAVLRRWLFDRTLNNLKSGLAPVTVLRGPRQVGKTTLQEQIIDYLLNEENVAPTRIFRVQFDEVPSLKGIGDPILSLCRWFEQRVLRTSFNHLAHRGEPVFLFFDEVQNLSDWAPQIKALVDHHTVRVLLTGSSALRIERGRDSLAGRISTLQLDTLLLREIASFRGWETMPPVLSLNGLKALKDQRFGKNCVSTACSTGAYATGRFQPFQSVEATRVAQIRADVPWEQIADQLNETVIRRVIQHDLRLGDRGRRRDENLLEEVFRLCCRYAGQSAESSYLCFGATLYSQCEHWLATHSGLSALPQRYAAHPAGRTARATSQTTARESEGLS